MEEKITRLGNLSVKHFNGVIFKESWYGKVYKHIFLTRCHELYVVYDF
jgi:hypothetical protein